MKIFYEQESNLIRVYIPYDQIKEVFHFDKLYNKILQATFLNKAVMLITISPQKYSLGNELPHGRTEVIGKTKLLINDVPNCTSDLLSIISQSEEFNRGLLIIVGGDVRHPSSLFEEIQNVERLRLLSNTIILCEGDGYSILLINNELTVNQLQDLVGNSE